MTSPKPPFAVAAVLAAALFSGAVAAVVAATFIWGVSQGTELLWTDLPKEVGLEPFGIQWLLIMLVGGGFLVALTQRYVGRYPAPMETVISSWKAGEPVEPKAVPRVMVSAMTVLVVGGPVGFEAALTGIIGGCVTFASRRIDAVEQMLRQVWGDDRVDSAPSALRHLPGWLAAIAGLVVYRWLPFGRIDFGFRFSRFDGNLSIAEGATAVAFAALLAVPLAWAFSVVSKAEGSRAAERRPILVPVAASLVFVAMAMGNEFVLFSGQQAIQKLPGLDAGALVYLTFAKWAALVIALCAGWRGGPVFPMYVAAASSAVLLADALGVRSDVVVVAGLAAVGVVLLKGSIPAACVLTLYAAPVSFAVVILIGAVGGAVALAIADQFGLVPRKPDAVRS